MSTCQVSRFGVQMAVMAVRLVGHSGGGAEMDAAGDRLAGGVVDDGDMDPVAAVFH